MHLLDLFSYWSISAWSWNICKKNSKSLYKPFTSILL